MPLRWETTEEEQKRREKEKMNGRQEPQGYDSWDRISDRINYQYPNRPPPPVEREIEVTINNEADIAFWGADNGNNNNTPSTSGPRPQQNDPWGAPESSESPEELAELHRLAQNWGVAAVDDETESYSSSDSPCPVDDAVDELNLYGQDSDSYESSDNPYPLDEDQLEAPEDAPKAQKVVEEQKLCGTVGGQDSESDKSSDSPYPVDEIEEKIEKKIDNPMNPAENKRFNRWGTADAISRKNQKNLENLEKESSPSEVRRFNNWNTLTPKKNHPKKSSESGEESEAVGRFQNYPKSSKESKKSISESSDDRNVGRFQNYKKPAGNPKKSRGSGLGNERGIRRRTPEASEVKTTRFQNYGAPPKATVAQKVQKTSDSDSGDDSEAAKAPTSRFQNFATTVASKNHQKPNESDSESSVSTSSSEDSEKKMSSESSSEAFRSQNSKSESSKSPEVETTRFQNFRALPKATVAPEEKLEESDSDESVAPSKPPTSFFRTPEKTEKITVAPKAPNPLENEVSSRFENSKNFSKNSETTVPFEDPKNDSEDLWDDHASKITGFQSFSQLSDALKNTVAAEKNPSPLKQEKQETPQNSIFDTLRTIRFGEVAPFRFSKDTTTAKDTVAKADCERLAQQLIDLNNSSKPPADGPVTLKSVRDSIKQKKKLKPYEGAEPQNVYLPSTSQNENPPPSGPYKAKLSNRVAEPPKKSETQKTVKTFVSHEDFWGEQQVDTSQWGTEVSEETHKISRYFSAYEYDNFQENKKAKEPKKELKKAEEPKKPIKTIEIGKMDYWNNNQYEDPEKSASGSRESNSSKEENDNPFLAPSSLSPELQERLARRYEKEWADNEFSQFYPRNNRKQLKPSTSSKKSISQYSHHMAIEFAATSWCWTEPPGAPQPRLPKKKLDLQCYVDQVGCRAYYRLIADKEDKYILMAVHVNVHGLHRADLRFVEVNDKTCLRGLEGKSAIGQLFVGDLLAVTEMARIRENPPYYCYPIRGINQESPCNWQVKKMTLLERDLVEDLKFSFLPNRMAIAKGFDEAMDVRGGTPEVDKLFVGNAFIPLKINDIWCTGFDKNLKNRVAFVASGVPAHPNPVGTIYWFKEDSEANRVFNIGTDAYKQEDFGYQVADREKVVETCVLMGYSAANAIFNGRFDCRAFPLVNPTRDGHILHFYISNPSSQPTLGRWNTNNKLNITGPTIEVSATIESVTETGRRDFLKIVARLARGSPYMLDFEGCVVYQREPPENWVLRDDFLGNMPENSNARKIIEVLYGAEPLTIQEYSKGTYSFPGEPVIQLNEFQNDYIGMILGGTPMVLGSSPFGCGKSMTIVTAAFEVHKRICEVCPLANQKQQLLITQSNYASVNLIEIAKKAKLVGSGAQGAKFVRYVSDKCWKELPDGSRTDYDMPILMEKLFSDWARGKLDPQIQRRCRHFARANYHNMLYWLLDNNIMSHVEFRGEARTIYTKMPELRKANNKICLEVFFVLYQPDIIMVTADSSLSLLHSRVLKDVITIQIDEASQLPEYTLFSLLVSFPNANFGLIGDIHQLPPYCVEELTGKLKDYGIGNTMERAVRGSLFPKAVLRYVYRCHPVTTRLLSDLFYEGDLISGVTEDMRNEFMLNMPRSFWPNPAYPMIIVNNQEAGYRCGTSCVNRAEVVLARQIVSHITMKSGYKIPAKDVGVISFYSAQTSQLTEQLRGSGVKCGTVDSFQGSEREVIILCLTNEKLTDFMQLSNRLNVAMSRARQSTIVIGNVDGMSKANYWSTVVQRAQEHGCIVDTNAAPFLLRN